jgi:hypothetical protein
MDAIRVRAGGTAASPHAKYLPPNNEDGTTLKAIMMLCSSLGKVISQKKTRTHAAINPNVTTGFILVGLLSRSGIIKYNHCKNIFPLEAILEKLVVSFIE